ncbi:hypothetical protein B0H14DRAFT_3504118 [Mycena olivaceomarginata]|nr:hypothetical protein B0H14DRAFT_3504118 [Mycena olivaceomarginata]
MKAFTVIILLVTAAFVAALPAEKRAVTVEPAACVDSLNLDVSEASNDRRGCNNDF